jgi:hypothetical protein
MCLMQNFEKLCHSLQLHHYQLDTHQHVIKVVTTTRTYWRTHDMVVNENSFKNRSDLEVRE